MQMKIFLHLVLIGSLFNCKLSAVSAWKIPIPGSNEDSTVVISGIAAKILSECYSDYTEVVIHGDSDPTVVKSFRQSETLAVMMFNDSKLIDDPSKLRLHRNAFVLTPHSIQQLGNLLPTFKESQRWNIMSPFIILDKSGRQCQNARKMLKIVWQMNLIEALFLCVNSQSVPMIYTFNPYTNRAPQPWKQVSNTAKQSARWTLFNRPHRDENLCEGVNFDRTKYLDSSVIKIAAKTECPEVVVPKDNYDEAIIPKLFEDIAYMVNMLKYSLNVTLNFTIDSEQALFDLMRNGSCDMLALLTKLGKGATYPVYHAPYYIVTNNRGIYTPLENIMNYYGPVTLVSMCIILPITFFVILFSTKDRRWSFAGFEILRLLINAALHTRFDKVALRIFFSTIFLYFLIIHATFQGHVVSFLMKQEYRANAETLEDLKHTRYAEIHLHWPLKPLITDPILLKKLVLVKYDCVSGVIANHSIAGICDPMHLIVQAFEHKLHVSQEPVFVVPNYHRIRKDWPLEQRFNTFLMLLESSGQSTKDWKEKYHSKIVETQKRITAMAAPKKIRPITMSMLDWIFVFLLIGLKISAIVLTGERRIRPEPIRLRDNRRAQLLNMEIRRRRLINEAISGEYLRENSRLHSI